jgi:hypothetical protein
MISSETVIKQYFEGLSGSVARLGIENKALSNLCDETGWSGKKSRQSVWLKM